MGEEILHRLKELAETLRKMDPEDFKEFKEFKKWAANILTKGTNKDKRGTIENILEQSQPQEVEEMITNVERVLKKSMKDAEEKGMEKGIEKGMEKVAKQMIADGEKTEKIIRHTGPPA